MSDLWNDRRAEFRKGVAPLAVRLRPRTLEEVAGQAHILGQDKLLRRMIIADRLTSVIFSGPPGTGKTSLAEVIARHTDSRFVRAHASSIGVKEVRLILAEAKDQIEAGGKRTILFLDEIHRFARNQQDVLLDHVERGLIILIGATTENPYFTINSALVSRSTVFRFELLSEEDIKQLILDAIKDERAFGTMEIKIDEDAINHWARLSDGDARRALSALEIAVLSQREKGDSQKVTIDLSCAEESIQAKAPVYDGTGDQHYDCISAFIKSMRGSDPDAAVYWLARMLDAGEDPRFIARRIAILASEDIGNADPQAILVANAAWQLTERIGLPECQLTLSHAAIYMACAPKSNACTIAIGSAIKAVKEMRTVEVPVHLRDPHSTISLADTQETDKTSQQMQDHKRIYKYPHNSSEGFVEQDYLGVNIIFYEPTDRGVEAKIKKQLVELRKRLERAKASTIEK